MALADVTAVGNRFQIFTNLHAKLLHHTRVDLFNPGLRESLNSGVASRHNFQWIIWCAKTKSFFSLLWGSESFFVCEPSKTLHQPRFCPLRSFHDGELASSALTASITLHFWCAICYICENEVRKMLHNKMWMPAGNAHREWAWLTVHESASVVNGQQLTNPRWAVLGIFAKKALKNWPREAWGVQIPPEHVTLPRWRRVIPGWNNAEDPSNKPGYLPPCASGFVVSLDNSSWRVQCFTLLFVHLAV